MDVSDKSHVVLQILENKSIIPFDKILGGQTVEDLGLDSLDSIEIIMEIEDAFDIEIPDAHAEVFITVSDLLNYVEVYT